MSSREKSHDAGALNSRGQFPLVPSADAGALARKNLHVKIHKTAQQAGVFIINIFHAVGAKEAFLFFFWLVVIHIFLVIASRRRSLPTGRQAI
jgi:hypothetical protein